MPRNHAKMSTMEPSNHKGGSMNIERVIQRKINRSQTTATKRALEEVSKQPTTTETLELLARFSMDLDKLLRNYPTLQFIGSWGVQSLDKELDGVAIISSMMRRGDNLTHKLMLDGLVKNIFK